MKKRIILFSFIIAVFMLVLFMLPQNSSMAASADSNVVEIQAYSQKYLDWLNLSDEEKANTIAPAMYDNPYTSQTNAELLRAGIMPSFNYVGASSPPSSYNLKNYMNINLGNQQSLDECWTFPANTSLETNIAKKAGQSYNFSERHMDYAASQSFTNGPNPNGGNRLAGSGGDIYMAMAYYTSGMGPVLESDMPFVNNTDPISLNNIQKPVQKRVDSYREFPQAPVLSTDMPAYLNMLKQSIMTYGAISADVYYDQKNASNVVLSADKKYLNVYCSDSSVYANHAVSIIGWDDNYSKSNFKAGNQPTSNGAFIVQNSWGAGLNGKTPEYTGYDYISYQDLVIYTNLWGIMSAEDISYNHLYQYDNLGPCARISYPNTTMNVQYGANVFTRTSSTPEMLTQVSIASLVDASYEVWVNSKDGTLDSANLTKVAATENLNAGYNTIKLSSPIELTGSEFAVVVKYTAPTAGGNPISIEMDPANLDSRYTSITYWSDVPISGKSYVSLDGTNWGKLSNADVCIKAFTIDKPDLNITSSVYNIDINRYVTNISPNTTVNQLLKNITCIYAVKVYNNVGQEITGQTKIGTGAQITADGKNYILAIKGDVNGDGQVTATDLSKMRQQLVGLQAQQGVYAKAMDVNLDGKVTATDLSKLRQALIGLIKL